MNRPNDNFSHCSPPTVFAGDTAGNIAKTHGACPSTAANTDREIRVSDWTGKTGNYGDKRKDHSSAMRESSSRAFSEKADGISAVCTGAYSLRRVRAWPEWAIAFRLVEEGTLHA